MPNSRVLPKKPLIEAIFELRWRLSSEEGDPHYPLFVGRLFDRVQSQYPFHEPLPGALVPLPLAQNVIQHRFRAGKDKWPLVQVGPGLVTVNDTELYTWQDFGQRSKSLVRAVFEAHPQPGQLAIANLVLRYVDAFELGTEEDPLLFLHGKLKSELSFPARLFDETGVSQKPTALNILASFHADRPKGNISVKFTSGRKLDAKALFLEIAVRSDQPELPPMPTDFDTWVESAHQLTEDWFFKFIEGDLERSFLGGQP